MATLTLQIPDALSARRREPKAAIVRALLESTVADAADPENPASRWLDHWRGSLRGRETPAPCDDRTQHLLNKHLR